MKLICAGAPKTGTKSIAQALRILGFKVCDYDEQILYHMDKWLDLYQHGKVPDFYSMFKDVDAVIDEPCNFFFEEMMEAFPDAKVTLSVREDEESWTRSYQKHMEMRDYSYLTRLGGLIPTHSRYRQIMLYGRMATNGITDSKSSYVCRKRYRWHNDRVKSVVPADKLLVYSVQQGWEPLCALTGKNIPDQPFPHLNVKAEIVSSFLTETALGRKIAEEVRVVKACFVAVMVALIGVIFFLLFRLY